MMRNQYSIWLFVAAVVLIPTAIYGMVKWYENRFTDLPVLGPEGHAVAGFHLQDHHGETISSDAWKDRITVVDFFFTHCPTICPKMTANMKTVQQAFANDDKVQITSFTVDPERDSIGQLKHYAQQAGISGNWHLVTGDKKELYRLARKSFLIVATDGDGGPDDFIHSELFILIDGKKRIRGFYNGTEKTEVETLIQDIRRLKRE